MVAVCTCAYTSVIMTANLEATIMLGNGRLHVSWKQQLQSTYSSCSRQLNWTTLEAQNDVPDDIRWRVHGVGGLPDNGRTDRVSSYEG